MALFKTNLMAALEEGKRIREQSYRGISKWIQVETVGSVVKAANTLMLFPVQLGSSIKTMSIACDRPIAALKFDLGVYYSDDMGNYTESVITNAFGDDVSGAVAVSQELLRVYQQKKTVYEIIEPNPITPVFEDEMKKHSRDAYVYIGLTVTTAATAATPDAEPVYFKAQVIESSPSLPQWKGEVIGG